MDLSVNREPSAVDAGGYTRLLTMTEAGNQRRDAPPAAEAAAVIEQAYLTLARILREVSEKKFRVPPADAEAV